MKASDHARQFTLEGLTFTVLEGGRRKGEGLRELLPHLYPALLQGLARRARKHPEVVRDALHTVLVRALERERRNRSKARIQHPEAYLETAAFREYQRSRGREARVTCFGKLLKNDTERIHEAWPSKEGPVWNEASAREAGVKAWERLERLPLRQRCVLAMWCSGFRIPEIARELETTPGNVRFHKHTAIQSVKAKLRGVAEETA